MGRLYEKGIFNIATVKDYIFLTVIDFITNAKLSSSIAIKNAIFTLRELMIIGLACFYLLIGCNTISLAMIYSYF